MAYATYSRGYKGPAYNVFFNMSPTQDNVLAPETSQSYRSRPEDRTAEPHACA